MLFFPGRFFRLPEAVQLLGNAHEHEAHVRYDREQHFPECLRLLHGEGFTRLPVGRELETAELYQP